MEEFFTQESDEEGEDAMTLGTPIVGVTQSMQREITSFNRKQRDRNINK